MVGAPSLPYPPQWALRPAIHVATPAASPRRKRQGSRRESRLGDGDARCSSELSAACRPLSSGQEPQRRPEWLRRLGDLTTAPERAPAVRDVLARVSLVGLTSAQLDDAGRLAPVFLRSFDAIHLAVALLLGDDLDGVVTYDARLRSTAEMAGLRCEAPGT